MPFVDGIWGCELLEAADAEGNPVINEVLYTTEKAKIMSSASGVPHHLV